MNKVQLREFYLNKRALLTQKEVQQISTSIADNLFSNINFNLGDSVHIFLPIKSKNEINTYPIVTRLEKMGVNIVVPITDFKQKKMTSVRYYTGQQTSLNKGIPEPIQKKTFDDDKLTHVLLPLTIFDKKGYRIGYGGGFYDRFLANLTPKVQKIGLSIFKPVDNCYPNQHDIPLNACVSADFFNRF